MQSIEHQIEAWNALSAEERRLHWEDFTEMLDAGDAGYHRFYRVLMPMWQGEEMGAAPAQVEGIYKPYHREPMAA